MVIKKDDVAYWMAKKYPDNPEYFWDMDKILEVINEHTAELPKKFNGFSSWETDRATDFDGPDDDDTFADIIRAAYSNGDSVEDAIQEYISSLITGHGFGAAYAELSDTARTLLDGAMSEINWSEVAEFYLKQINLICPICHREECDGKEDTDWCENCNGYGQPICPECKQATCANVDGRDEYDCTTEPCPCCGKKDCPAAQTQDETDCEDYEEPEEEVEDILNQRIQDIAESLSHRSLEMGPTASTHEQADEQFRQMKNIYWPESEAPKSSINYEDVEALGGWDAYFAFRDKFKPDEKDNPDGGDNAQE
jgi:hypothetical protein